MMRQKSFTLIELLVVIAVMGLLSSIVLVSLSQARERARRTKAQAELNQFNTAIFRLYLDTEKWPCGCPPDVHDVFDPEITLDAPEAGLVSQPPVVVIDPPCEWTADDVAEWQGPYVQIDQLIDPWGNPYWADLDYWPYKNCPSIPDEGVTAVVVSLGLDNAWYSCDDIFVRLIR